MDLNVVLGIGAFLVVAGYAALAWLRHGRDPAYLDDDSILLPAPPPRMTPATATVVAGGGTHVAFMAALLDLASRDELAFVAEDRPDRVGIAFRGGETTDPRVLLNRRNPIGEAETWLLGELKASLAIAARRGSDDDVPPSPEMVAAGMQMFGSLLRMGAAADDGYETRAAREHGLDSVALPDAGSIQRAYEARTGHPMSEKARAGIEHLTSGISVASAMSNPAAVAADPERYASMLEQVRDEPTTPEEHRQLVAQVREWASKAQSAPPTPQRIPAAEARHLQAPFLFGTLLQAYAKRRGWIGGLSVIATVKWTLLAALELVAGIALAVVGSRSSLVALQSLGGGIAAAGVATYLIGGQMPALSQEGAVMKAQLAAYRRTLAATFAGANTLEDAVGTQRLPWLETPDQAIVWGMALGLRPEIEALMARTGRAVASGQAPANGYAPAWYSAGSPTSAADASPAHVPLANAAAMFAGIEAIGSERASSASGR